MSNLDLARVQVGSTTIYHFLFVPITIGLGFLVAILQTMCPPAATTEAPEAPEPAAPSGIA